MSTNNPYAKLGGGALDQELFKKNLQQKHISDEKTVQTLSTISSSQPIQEPTPSSPVPIKLKRKQISSYLNLDQLKMYKKLYTLLNDNIDGDTEIEKSDIVALGIEVLSLLVHTQVPKYSNTRELRKTILDEISKYLDTQVLKM